MRQLTKQRCRDATSSLVLTFQPNHLYIYIYIKINEKRKSSFSLLLRYVFHRCCGSSGIAKTLLCFGDVGSNPAQGKYSFPQKLSSVEFPLTFSQFLLNLDCESICDPPGGGDTLLAQGIYLTDSLH